MAKKKTSLKPTVPRARVGRAASKALKVHDVNPDNAAKDMMLMLCSEFTPESLKAKLNAMLTATETYTNSKGHSFTRPNWGPRAKALELLLAYIVGRPIERQQVIKANAPLTLDDLVEQAESSPVFLDSLLNLLNQIKHRAGNIQNTQSESGNSPG